MRMELALLTFHANIFKIQVEYLEYGDDIQTDIHPNFLFCNLVFFDVVSKR